MSNESVQVKPLPSIGVFLSEAWANYKSKFLMTVQIALVPTVIEIILALVSPFDLDFIKSAIQTSNYHFLWISIPLGLLSAVISYLAAIALTILINDQSVQGSVLNYYQRASEKFFSYLWLGVLTGLVALAALCLFIFPIVIVGIWISLATCILINENIGGIAALVKSRNYVRGYWWEFFARFLVTFVVLLVVGAAIGVLLLPFKILELRIHASLISAVVAIVSSLVSLVVAKVLGIAFLVTTYRQIRVVKASEGNVASGADAKNLFNGLAILGLIIVIVGFLAVPFLISRLRLAKQLELKVPNQDFQPGFTQEP